MNRFLAAMVGTPRISKGRPFGSRSFEPRSTAAFGQVVRALRLEAGVSQEELAHRSNLERAHLGRIERGENQPTLWVVLKLAEGLMMPPGVLVEQTVERMLKLK
jgi:DNA-binding XRE family transcriptional regulator